MAPGTADDTLDTLDIDDPALRGGEWLFKRDGQVFGPVDSRRLAALLYQGEIDGATLVSAGNGAWTPVAQVPLFLVHAKQAEAGLRVEREVTGQRELRRRRGRVRALALALPFQPVVFTDARGREYWKPHPWSFEVVMAASPRAGKYVYVADNTEKDFVAPNRLGWTTIRLRHPENLRPSRPAEGDAHPTFEVDRFEALLELA